MLHALQLLLSPVYVLRKKFIFSLFICLPLGILHYAIPGAKTSRYVGAFAYPFMEFQRAQAKERRRAHGPRIVPRKRIKHTVLNI
jgi:hypothetical protein